MRNLEIGSLPNNKDWVDRDIIMLHACFQILKDFIEQETPFEKYEFMDEAMYLYNWWNKRIADNDFDDDAQDVEMLDRLISIRRYLWT